MVSKKTEGFVLPYVLFVIFVLSVAGVIAAQRLNNATQTVLRFEERGRAQQALFTAEADAVFSVISGITIPGGLALNPQAAIPDFFDINEDDQEIDPDLWQANGQWRQSQTSDGNVYVSLQDAAGLISLNTSPAVDLIKIFKFLGLTSEDATMISARLLDYVDINKTRRFRGAERSDYALRKLPGPTNSPIRNHQELNSILGWGELSGRMSNDMLKAYTTLRLTGVLRDNYAKPPLLEVMGEAGTTTEPADIDLTDLERASVLPSDYSRITLIYPYASGGYMEKAIEIRRQVNNVDVPYTLFGVYEKHSSKGAGLLDIETSNLKNVIHATSGLSE